MELKTIFAQDGAGNVIPLPRVHLYLPGGTVPVTGLKNAAGEDLPNPFTGTAGGQIQVAAPDGDYIMRIQGAGRDYSQPARFIDASANVAATLEAKDAAVAAAGSAMVSAGAAGAAAGTAVAAAGDAMAALAGAEAIAGLSGEVLALMLDPLNTLPVKAVKLRAGVAGGAFSVATGLSAPLAIAPYKGNAAIDFSAAGSSVEVAVASGLTEGQTISAVARVAQEDGTGVMLVVDVECVAETTVGYSYEDVSKCMTGGLRYNNPAGKTALYASSPTHLPGVIVLPITGTAASIKLFQNVSSQPAGMVKVSLDGGETLTNAPVVSGRYQLFSGLPQARRIALVYIDPAYGATANIPDTGDVLTVTGAPPALRAPDVWAQVGDDNPLIATASALEANPAAGFVPPMIVNNDTGVAQNNPIVSFRASAAALLVVASANYLYLSKDGAAPVRYALGASAAQPKIALIEGLSGTGSYQAWTNASARAAEILSVGILGGAEPAALLPGATSRKLIQAGDSITAAVAATSSGEVEVFAVAAAMGYVGSNFGISGNTIADLLARAPAILDALTVTSVDVAIIAIGRNSVGGGLDAAEQADYRALLDVFAAKPFGKIVCRGVLPEASNTYAAENAVIAAIVADYGDDRVEYCPVNTWTDINRPDGVHQDDLGYVQTRAYAQPAYEALLPGGDN